MERLKYKLQANHKWKELKITPVKLPVVTKFNNGYPLSVQTNPATNISFNSAQLNGFLLGDNGQACLCYFQWGLTNAYGHTTSNAFTGFAFANFHIVINGLTANTTYHFRAVGNDQHGHFAYGADLNFTTNAAPVVTGGGILA